MSEIEEIIIAAKQKTLDDGYALTDKQIYISLAGEILRRDLEIQRLKDSLELIS